MSENDEIIEVYCAENEADARMIQAALTEAGIACRVVGQFLTGAIGEIPAGVAASPGVWVPADQAQKARKIIDELESSPGPFRIPTWICPKCDEEVDSGLNTCWNCLYSPSAC